MRPRVTHNPSAGASLTGLLAAGFFCGLRGSVQQPLNVGQGLIQPIWIQKDRLTTARSKAPALLSTTAARHS